MCMKKCETNSMYIHNAGKTLQLRSLTGSIPSLRKRYNARRRTEEKTDKQDKGHKWILWQKADEQEEEYGRELKRFQRIALENLERNDQPRIYISRENYDRAPQLREQNTTSLATYFLCPMCKS